MFFLFSCARTTGRVVPRLSFRVKSLGKFCVRLSGGTLIQSRMLFEWLHRHRHRHAVFINYHNVNIDHMNPLDVVLISLGLTWSGVHEDKWILLRNGVVLRLRICNSLNQRYHITTTSRI